VGRTVKIGLVSGLCCLLVAVGATATGAAGSSAPNTDWSSLLPALPSPLKPQPGPVPHCRRPTLGCITTEVHRLKHLRDRLRCDHRAVFATTYLALTRTLKRVLVRHPHFFRYPHHLFTEDALFADVYFNTVHRSNRGRSVPDAWRIAFGAARSADVNGAQDMLLGINAHVQNDMPFVLAALGLRTRSGTSRKPDHDRVNEVLNRAYKPVVHAVKRRYDDRVGLTNSDLTPLDDAGGLELVRGWREQVWRNAERLVNARSDRERKQVARQIEANAAGWARAITAFQTPGDRARRDAYCRAQLDG
jgi:hypothetical protein